MKEQKKDGRGGTRPGSGRKRDPNKRQLISCRVSPFTAMQIRAIAAELNIGIGEALDELVRSYILNEIADK